jgi:hypothetical protein
MSKRDRLSADEVRAAFAAEIEDLYTFEQRDEAKRLLKENPARGRIPTTTVGKVQTLHKRGVNTSLPPFAAETPAWVRDIVDNHGHDEIRIAQLEERRAESLEGVDKAEAQAQSVDSKCQKLLELLARYSAATGIKAAAITSARVVAKWAVDDGAIVQKGATRTVQIDNLTKRLRRCTGLK